MIDGGKASGLTCCHARIATPTTAHAQRLSAAASTTYTTTRHLAEFYGDIITTRTYQSLLDTLDSCAEAAITVCCVDCRW